MNDKFSRLGFILSIVGAAIGLGNAWKFPYMVGSNGGSAFVLVYLVFAIVVGLSIFFAEISMGRLAKTDPVNSFRMLAPSNKRVWGFAGVMMITGIFVASFYTLIIGWVAKYALNSFFELPADIQISSAQFGAFISAGAGEQILYFTLAFFAYFFVLAKGIKGGIESINLLLIPTLFVLILLMLVFSTTMDGFKKALEFLLVPDFSKLTAESIFMALGLAFFTMCVGIGAIVTYSANMNDSTNLFTSSLYVVALNIIISITIGLVIFTFVFEFDAQPSQGVGLAFISLPTLFAKFGEIGHFLCFTFFIALVFAGLTSAVSMVEPFIFFLEREFGLSRLKAISIVGAVVYVLGILCALSNVDGFKEGLTFFERGFFDWLDYIASNVMLPLGGIVFCVFVGYIIKREDLEDVFLKYMGRAIFEIWYFLLRFVAPVCVFVVFVVNSGLYDLVMK
ncbi:sodium-dependent transporter [Campylobacter sp. 9BO]|uniref:sodium-dependent transporter n=1 Tax=Campylobacter sp. 9BO TaxID=3424759 RepID=UPI003D34879F